MNERREALTQNFASKEYRDTYVASHARDFLAAQVRALRGERSVGEFARAAGLSKSAVHRIEAGGNVGIRTLLTIARRLDIALVVRFVDCPTFIELTEDFSEDAFSPRAGMEIPTVGGVDG